MFVGEFCRFRMAAFTVKMPLLSTIIPVIYRYMTIYSGTIVAPLLASSLIAVLCSMGDCTHNTQNALELLRALLQERFNAHVLTLLDALVADYFAPALENARANECDVADDALLRVSDKSPRQASNFMMQIKCRLIDGVREKLESSIDMSTQRTASRSHHHRHNHTRGYFARPSSSAGAWTGVAASPAAVNSLGDSDSESNASELSSASRKRSARHFLSPDMHMASAPLRVPTPISNDPVADAEMVNAA